MQTHALIESTRLAPVDVAGTCGRGCEWLGLYIVAIMAGKDKENLPVEWQPKCAKLSRSLPKDRYSFSVDDKDLKTYLVKKHGTKQQVGSQKLWGLV